ncbi:hypothetical protein LTR08_002288 [Meristemomyces frigidus]|nr:hypothetical protein LTR08_002288 [Meristemomyces frigidus]
MSDFNAPRPPTHLPNWDIDALTEYLTERPAAVAYTASPSTADAGMPPHGQDVPPAQRSAGQFVYPSNSPGYSAYGGRLAASSVFYGAEIPPPPPPRLHYEQSFFQNTSIGQTVAHSHASQTSPDTAGQYATPLGPIRRENATGRRYQPRQSSADLSKDKFQCEDCVKLGKHNHYLRTKTTSATRCRKHHAKWLKEQASTQAPTYTFDFAITSFEDARNYVYPMVQPLAYEGRGEDDFRDDSYQETDWVMRFIAAANMEYTAAEVDGLELDSDQKREHEHLLKQQDTYNHKPHEKSSKESYTNAFINIRMRFLYHAVLTFHQGGPAVYPVGGANGGYGEDNKMSMTERLYAIEAILREEKRVVMDVVEGRGVLALAANPGMYKDRKASNNKCNTKKKGKFQLADEIEAQRALKRAETGAEGDGDEEYGQQEDEVTAASVAARGRKGKRKAQEPSRGGRGRGGKRQSVGRGSMEQEEATFAERAHVQIDPAMTSAGIYGGVDAEDGAGMSGEVAFAASSDVPEFRAPVADMAEPTLWQSMLHRRHISQHAAPAPNFDWRYELSASTTAGPSHELSYDGADMPSGIMFDDPMLSDSEYGSSHGPFEGLGGYDLPDDGQPYSGDDMSRANRDPSG